MARARAGSAYRREKNGISVPHSHIQTHVSPYCMYTLTHTHTCTHTHSCIHWNLSVIIDTCTAETKSILFMIPATQAQREKGTKLLSLK